MALSDFLSIAVDWLSYDALTDLLCIVLALAVFAILRNVFRQSR